MAFVSAKIATKSQYCKFFLKEYIAQSMINWLRSLNSNLSSDHKMYSFYYYGMFPDIIYFFRYRRSMHRRCLRDFHCFVLIILRPLRVSVWHFLRNLTLCSKPYHSKIQKNPWYYVYLCPSMFPCALLDKNFILSFYLRKRPLFIQPTYICKIISDA